jgi:hypothetical protein
LVERFHRRLDRGSGDRMDALRETLNEYRHNMHSNEPVHTWS